MLPRAGVEIRAFKEVEEESLHGVFLIPHMEALKLQGHEPCSCQLSILRQSRKLVEEKTRWIV